MVQPSQDRNCNHPGSLVWRGMGCSIRFGNLLLNPLMRSCPIEVCHIFIEHTLELLLMEDQQMVKAFLPHTPHKALANGVRSWGMIRRFENLNSTRCRHPSEARPKFAIIIENQILRSLPI